MTQFKVTVYTRVKEVYYVEAGNAEEAREKWHDGELDMSECIEIDDVIVREAEV